MKKHFAHYLLILLLAIAPVQSVLAGISALEHATACEMGAMTGAGHEGMNHTADVDKASEKCSCCADCMMMCMSATHASYPATLGIFSAINILSAVDFNYGSVSSSQHPFTDIRPPIVLS